MKFVLLLSLLTLSSCENYYNSKHEESPIVVLEEFDKCFNIDSIPYIKFDYTPNGIILSRIQPVWHNKKITQMYNKLEAFYMSNDTRMKKLKDKTLTYLDCAVLMYPVLK